MTEADFLDLLRGLPLHPGALGLADDAARLSGDFVVTTDTMVEGIHFLPTDPPGDVAWKLLAVNLSDLAAKGAKPVGGAAQLSTVARTIGTGRSWRDWGRRCGRSTARCSAGTPSRVECAC